MNNTNTPGICSQRLELASYAKNFASPYPPLTPIQATIAAERCYYCYDAPCQQACPTAIDVPAFIARIAQNNVRGAAEAILSANPLGGMCARVCPTEVLCEEACVRNTLEDQPVEIGLLQRFATDHYAAQKGPPLFHRAAKTHRKVAVVGAGPAGLSCAHGLARAGHEVSLFDRQAKLGGLNEYGLAAYKVGPDFAQQEIADLLAIGGIKTIKDAQLGRNLFLHRLLSDYDAVFLGLGLAGVKSLGLTEPKVKGLYDAVDFIARVRQAKHLKEVAVGRQVVVIGGGMTAIDAAVQAKKLGAKEVVMVYRRGVEAMSASAHEQEWAKRNGVVIWTELAPMEILADQHKICGVRFKELSSGLEVSFGADMVLKAIGQSFIVLPTEGLLTLQDGRIWTDEKGQTSHPQIWAGGDCRYGGRDLTVEAVEHGKQSALAINAYLAAKTKSPNKTTATSSKATVGRAL